MTGVETEPAAASRWWVIGLGVAILVCTGTAALALLRTDTTPAPLAATVGVLVAYTVFFVLVVRRVPAGSLLARVSVAVTIAVLAVCVALVPSNAIVQFWTYPLVWTLVHSVRGAVVATFVAAAAVFAGFGVSTGSDPDWVVTAGVTQTISYGVNLMLGIWITRVYRYAEERQVLLDELTVAQGQVAALHRDAGMTAERERLSRELHDTIAQSLAGTVLLVQRSRRELAAGELDPATLGLAEDAARAALAETRALVAGMAPVELAGGGIADALVAIAVRFDRETEMAVTVAAQACEGVDREAEVALLRCAQEGLANARRHADATAVRLELAPTVDAAELRIVDDGHGFDPHAAGGGFGLPGLRSRLALVGGTLEVVSSPDGTVLLARVPRVHPDRQEESR